MTKKLIARIVVAAIAALLVLCLVLSVFRSVPSGHTGILTTFGDVEEEAILPGLRVKLPWQLLICMDNRIRTTRIASGVKNATTNDTAETKDQQLVPTFEFEVQHQLIQDMTYKVYSNYGSDYEERLITTNALQIIKQVFALYNATQIVTAKAEIPAKICEELNAITSPMGVEIKKVNFVTYDFSPEYTAILEQRALLDAQLVNNKLQQQNETIAAQTQYDVAVKYAEKEAETQRIAAENANNIAIANANAKAETDRINAENDAYVTRTRAEAQKDARMAAAEAEKAELEAKASGINDYVIQQEFIEKWDGKLIPSFGDVGLGFTNYTDIISKYLFDQTEFDSQNTGE